ncbi:hypothetical protein [Candidatus Palauibacter sp.]|uniref:hypothetical protein n=1 Tax=Candidatus Palauibacter sp. TaxID=3101350 RepID=UPI003CC5D085
MTVDDWLACRPRLSFATGLVLIIMLGVAACGTERDITGREPKGPEIPRTSLTVHVRLQPSDSTLASALGWESGVPGSEVNLLRTGTEDWIRLRTDATGQARLANILPARYRVYAGRFLTPGEASAAELPVRSFGDGTTTEISGRGEQLLEFELSSDVPGSLLISELNSWSPPPWETGGGYTDGHYFEVYNNSERTLFLDGMVFGGTVRGSENIRGHCAHSQAVRSDSLGVYSLAMLAFPGAGSEYPIGPGETRLVAISAIDHTPVHPELPDLSHADFEIRGARGADNPAVPNMIDVGLRPFVIPLGGAALSVLGGGIVGYFIAEPFDAEELPIMYRDFAGQGHVRVSRDLLLDVVGRDDVFAETEREYPPCVPLVHPYFDRYPGGFYNIAIGRESSRLSLQRRGLRSEGGRDILSNANTSAVDFVLADLTPGFVLWP